MLNSINNKFLFWLIFLSLLFAPIAKSFFVNCTVLVKTFVFNYQCKNSVNELLAENNSLKNKVKYYMTTTGYKALIKERLEKLDKGEVLIKYSN